jgi:hypothetical protein
MIRMVHTACAALLVAVALIAYGVKEETRALQREIKAVERETGRVEREIAALGIEWSYLNSPAVLRQIAVRLYGRDGMVGVDGAALVPWTAAQVRALEDPVDTPAHAGSVSPLLAEIDRAYGAPAIETATIPAAPPIAPPNAPSDPEGAPAAIDPGARP